MGDGVVKGLSRWGKEVSRACQHKPVLPGGCNLLSERGDQRPAKWRTSYVQGPFGWACHSHDPI